MKKKLLDEFLTPKVEFGTKIEKEIAFGLIKSLTQRRCVNCNAHYGRCAIMRDFSIELRCRECLSGEKIEDEKLRALMYMISIYDNLGENFKGEYKMDLIEKGRIV